MMAKHPDSALDWKCDEEDLKRVRNNDFPCWFFLEVTVLQIDFHAALLKL